MYLRPLTGSTLALLEGQGRYRLFCQASLGLMEVRAADPAAAMEIAERTTHTWPKRFATQQSPYQALRTLTLCLTSKCNLACDYCYLHGEAGRFLSCSAPAEDPQLRRWQEAAIMRELDQRPAKLFLNFFGGEPLLERHRLQELAEFARRHAQDRSIAVKYGLTTNGTQLDANFLRWADEFGLHIMISLDSPPELHDRYRAAGRRGASFQELTERIRGWECNLTAATIITHQTPSLRAALEPLLHREFKEVAFNFVDTPVTELALTPEDARRMTREVSEDENWFARHAGRIMNLRVVHEQLAARAVRSSPCRAGAGNYALGADGSRYFCHRCVGIPAFRLSSGISIEQAQRETTGHLGRRMSCGSCWARRLCGGECWLNRHDTQMEQAAIRCELTRTVLMLALSTFAGTPDRAPQTCLPDEC